MALEPYLDGASELLVVFAVALVHGRRMGDDFLPGRPLSHPSDCSLCPSGERGCRGLLGAKQRR